MKRNAALQNSTGQNYKGVFQSNLMNISVVWIRTADNSLPHEKWNTKKHFHNFYELHIVQEGVAQFQVDEHSICLKKGNYILFPPKCPHSFQEVSPDYKEFVAGFYMDFSNSDTEGKYIRDVLQAYNPNEPLVCNSYIERYMEDCLRYIRNRPYHSSGIVMNICLLLLEMSKQLMPNIMEAEEESKNEELIDEIKSYIAFHLSNGVDTSSVANHVHFSERHLNRLLQTELQKSVKDLILDEKMSCIRRLLETTDLTLEAIAEQAGYTNAYNMSRAFRKCEGTSPGNYRKALRMSSVWHNNT